VRVIQITDDLSPEKFERLARIVGMVTDAMVDEYWGSLEFKFERGNPLPHVPARESRVLYERK
jgi:hypothetical protein